MLTIDTSAIDRAIIDLIAQRVKTAAIKNNSKQAAENQKLKQLEQEFTTNYGEQLRSILEEVYDDLCPDDEVQAPLNYLAENYKIVSQNGKGNMYDVSHHEGVSVEVDEYGQAPTKMVILPNPLRIVLNIDAHTKEEVWSVNL